MRYLKVITAALFVIVVVIFILQNGDLHRSVNLRFGWNIFETGLGTPAPTKSTEGGTAAPAAEAARPGVNIPVFILIFLAFFLGLILASLFSLAEKYRLKRVVRVGAGRVKQLEEEIKSLRNMPLTGPADVKPVIKPTPVNSGPKTEAKKDKGSPLPTGLSRTKGLPEPETKPAPSSPLNREMTPKGAPDNKNQPLKPGDAKPAPSSPLPGPAKKEVPANGIASRPLEVKANGSPKAAPSGPVSKSPAPDQADKDKDSPAGDKDQTDQAPAKKSSLFSRLTGNGKKKAEEDKKGD